VATRKKTVSFEENLKELEHLVEALEAGGMTLDESLKAFEQGVRITQECQQALDSAEQTVQLLTRNGDGGISGAPLDDPEATS
jgi:exodeoxyribonuclease VII small subunit